MSASRIKEAALKLFALNGYEATTMREIGKEVGIRASTIYSHFESKEQIFLEVIHDLFRKFTWEKIDISNISDEDFNLKAILFKIFLGYYHFFSKHQTELLFWQRIRFFTPVGLEGTYDVNKLAGSEYVHEIYFKLFERAAGLKQINPKQIELRETAFFAFVSGCIDSLILMPFQLSEAELEALFNIYWFGNNYSNDLYEVK